MSDVIETAIAAVNGKIDGLSTGSSIKVVIEGEGSFIIDGDGARAGDEECDCTMTADAETFQGMMSGDVNPTSAFMTGKLSVDGDMSAAMALGAALS